MRVRIRRSIVEAVAMLALLAMIAFAGDGRMSDGSVVGMCVSALVLFCASWKAGWLR